MKTKTLAANTPQSRRHAGPPTPRRAPRRPPPARPSLEACHPLFGPPRCGVSRRNETTVKTFQLDQPGDSIRFEPFTGGALWASPNLGILGLASAGFRGEYGSAGSIMFRRLSFWPEYIRGFLLLWDSRWQRPSSTRGGRFPGVGFVGFRFNNGAGFQYGWARVRMGGIPRTTMAFRVWTTLMRDPGEPVTALGMMMKGTPRKGRLMNTHLTRVLSAGSQPVPWGLSPGGRVGR